MFKGVTFALAACFIWGLIFVVPLFLDGFSSIEIALGRYLFYGMISSSILLQAKLKGIGRYHYLIWIKAFYFSLICTFVYYTSLILALRYACPAICALIIGISPITIAYYGNWKQKENQCRKLIFPSFLILLGLIIINAPYLFANESSNYLLGLIFSLLSLLSWSWYVVANAQFLKNNLQIASSDWSTLIGVATLFWVGICTLFISLFFSEGIEIDKFTFANPGFLRFLVGCAILGILCSWIGAFLWNRASLYLPVSLAGQLTVFETIFGLIFIYAVNQSIPNLSECLGMILMIGAIIYGVRNTSEAKMEHAI